MPKRQVKPDQLATEFAFDNNVVETPEQKQQRIRTALVNTQNLVGEINGGNRVTRQLQRDDMVMRKAYRRAVSEAMSLNDLAVGLERLPGLSMSDVMLPDAPMPGRHQFLTEEFPTNHDDVIMEEFYQQPTQPQRPVQRPAQRSVQQTRPPIRQSLAEERPVQRRPDPEQTTENWRVKSYLGETRSGKEVHVWKVENAKTGSSLRNLFRIEGVASRIAMMLNESGDNNDPRVLSLVNTYEKRDKLLKEARQLEKNADGKQMKGERLRQIRAEINQLDYKLGV